MYLLPPLSISSSITTLNLKSLCNNNNNNIPSSSSSILNLKSLYKIHVTWKADATDLDFVSVDAKTDSPEQQSHNTADGVAPMQSQSKTVTEHYSDINIDFSNSKPFTTLTITM
ncbi:hypothetical protein TSUD_149320 [Trifolium subterraneum]|uniref:Uncharacterized protein n=1 Tax=Trifolium subterraneum TaxID=3900 RepID=A0A2Z6MEQ1_TRISU|nr:hypothetical protein TSUD_149320 [Trifolium subterraneum]